MKKIVILIVLLVLTALTSKGQPTTYSITNENEGWTFMNSYEGKEKSVSHKMWLEGNITIKIVKVAYTKSLLGKVEIVFKEETTSIINGVKTLSFKSDKKVNYIIVVMAKL